MRPVEFPIRVTGMDEFRAAVAEIKAGAVDLKALGTAVNVTIHIGETVDVQDLAQQVAVELARTQRMR